MGKLMASCFAACVLVGCSGGAPSTNAADQAKPGQSLQTGQSLAGQGSGSQTAVDSRRPLSTQENQALQDLLSQKKKKSGDN